MTTKLRLMQQHWLALKSHLFPGDGNEAVAIALCGGRSGSQTHYLIVALGVIVAAGFIDSRAEKCSFLELLCPLATAMPAYPRSLPHVGHTVCVAPASRPPPLSWPSHL